MNITSQTRPTAPAAGAADAARIPRRNLPAHRVVRVAALTMDGSPRLVSQARQFIDVALQRWGTSPGCRDLALLITSELVTNSVIHGGSEVTLVLQLHPGFLSIHVSDSGDGPNSAITAPSASDEHGRGLAIVRSLSSAHGSRRDQYGTHHWARLKTG